LGHALQMHSDAQARPDTLLSAAEFYDLEGIAGGS
jgi:hypothetical protein